VPDKDDVLFLALIRDGEISIAGYVGLDFDEIHASVFQHVHRAAAVIGSGDCDRGGELSLGAVEHGASYDHARAKERSRGCVATSGED